MARQLLLTMIFLVAGLALHAQGSLQGRVTDVDSGEPILFGAVALFKNGVLVTGVETDLDGYYSITEIDPGTYTVEFTYTGYGPSTVTGVNIGNRVNKLDAKMIAGINLQEVIIEDARPLIEQDNTTQGMQLNSEDIKNLPTRSVAGIAALSAGVSSADEGEALNFRGSRSNATNFYIDGVRVSGRDLPKSEYEALQIITGGIEARYGDVTGGIVSGTTKGPSEKFGGGVELESSKLFDQYDHRLASLNLSGPIWKKADKTILGYRIAAQYQYNKDDDPPALPVYAITDETRQQLEANPVVRVGNTVYPAAEYVDFSGVQKLKYKPNEDRTSVDLVGKLDFNVGKNVDFTVSGTVYEVRNKFTPGNWRTFNSHNNPESIDRRLRGNVRLRHRLGGASAAGAAPGEQRKGSVIQNAAYTLQFGYEKTSFSDMDKNHKDNIFDYGYIGKFDRSWEPTLINSVRVFADPLISPNELIETSQEHVAYTGVLNSFDPTTSTNPLMTQIIGADFEGSFDEYQVQNGILPSALGSTWDGLHANIGSVYNSNRKRKSDLYTFNANTSFELVPGGSGNARHNIQFGITYEQTVSRGYDVFPFNLWENARLLANQHLLGQGLDTLTEVGTRPVRHTIFDRITGIVYVDDTIQVSVYAPNVEPAGGDNLFFKRVREKFNIPVNQYFNVDGVNPGDLSLDMFSARELNDRGYINYWGYDYLGNQLDGVTFEDFFTAVDGNGIRTFPVAANQPNYSSAFLQDKFTFKDIIFRLGVRVDRFDANTKILKDEYSLYEVMGASDFDTRFGTTRPGNIGEDYKVYVTSEGGDIVKAYRSDDTWYFPNGNPANDGSEILGSEIVYPRYLEDDETKRDITSPNFEPDISFKDYEPQVNWMPRLAFSFPISETANFFAHYDVLVQRPPSNTFVSPRTYFYWESAGSGLRNNAALKPEKTIDYEVGYKQGISQTSALTISAYYKELRDMIQARIIRFVPAPINDYETFDNLDFATVKGFSVSYEMRRTGNITLNLNYTLQFADGTGSNSESSRSLPSRAVQRTLFPMSYDERHRLTGIMDYRFQSGDKYNGPRIGGIDLLANTGLNLTATAVSGRPYTSAVQPEILGSAGIAGAINGSRLPWNMVLNAQLDKSFDLTKPGAKRSFGMNVYLRVSNVLDRRNIQGVYTFTGSATDDGFLASARGQKFLEDNTYDAEGRSEASYLASYQWRLLNPDNFSLPRRMFLGLMFDF